MDDEVVRAREVLDRIGADLERAIPPDWSPGLLRDEDEQPKLKDHPALAYLHGHWELGQVLRSLPTRASWARPKQALRALFARLLGRAQEARVGSDLRTWPSSQWPCR